MAKMKAIKEVARKRRAALLKEFNKLNATVTDFAELHGVTRARMGQLLKQAKTDVI
jgi:excinuclease UvrABC nuclease subunit